MATESVTSFKLRWCWSKCKWWYLCRQKYKPHWAKILCQCFAFSPSSVIALNSLWQRTNTPGRIAFHYQGIYSNKILFRQKYKPHWAKILCQCFAFSPSSVIALNSLWQRTNTPGRIAFHYQGIYSNKILFRQKYKPHWAKILCQCFAFSPSSVIALNSLWQRTNTPDCFSLPRDLF